MKKFFTLLAMMVMLSFSSQAAYYIVGNAPFGNWNPADGTEMTLNADGTFSCTATINGAIWFVFSDGLDSSWDTFNANYRIGPTGSADEDVTPGQWINTQKAPSGSKSYKFTGTGDQYEFIFDPANMRFKVDGYVAPVPIDFYTVCGSPVSVFGTEWDPTNTDNDMIELADGTFELKKFGCELAEGTNLEFKIAGNHTWDYSWPADNVVLPVNQSGSYDITFNFNPETKDLGVQMSMSGSIEVITGDLFILGEVDGNTWDPSDGVKMETEDNNIFTSTITTAGENIDDNDGIGYSYFSFTTKLGENSDDWSGIAAYRIGATEDGYLLTPDLFGMELPMSNFGQTYSFRIAAGTYHVTVNLEAKTLVITPAGDIPVEGDYDLVKLWEITDLSMLPVADCRQGFGMNGMFYINNKADKQVMVVGENGLANTTYPGGANCGITRDEAGNLVISNATFPDAWSAEATIKVINPETNDMKEYVVPADCTIDGRCDFLGFAKGNLMEDGVLYLTGATNNGVSIMTIAGGEVSVDDCYAAPVDGLTPTSSTVINYYKDLNDQEALLYVTRNAQPMKLIDEDETITATAITVPAKGTCNGMFPFIWDGKEFFIYPQEPNYQNGFAIAEDGAEEPIVTVPSTVTGNANSFQGDWLNAEVDEDGVTIYQYYPGGNIAVYRLTKKTGDVNELVNDVEKVVSNIRYYNIMGQEIREPNGLTIVVTTYTDGSHKAVKVIK
jgi:hypothetical protein